MIKAAVFSDSHGSCAYMFQAIDQNKPDLIIHLGDYEKDANILRERYPEIPVHNVRGNCDMFGTAPEQSVITVGTLPVFLTHGHLQNVKWNLLSLSYAALEAECRLALFGHTHIPCNEFFNGVHLVNPGTAGQTAGHTWAWLTVEEDGSYRIDIRNF